MILRDDARHNTLVIAKKENTQGYKYTGKVSINLSACVIWCRGDYAYTKALPVRPCICLSPPDMIIARRCSARVIYRGAGFGISISSLTSPR